MSSNLLLGFLKETGNLLALDGIGSSTDLLPDFWEDLSFVLLIFLWGKESHAVEVTNGGLFSSALGACLVWALGLEDVVAERLVSIILMLIWLSSQFNGIHADDHKSDERSFHFVFIKKINF